MKKEAGMLANILLYSDSFFWFFLFVLFLVIELFTLNLITIWFSAGALVSSITSLIKITSSDGAKRISLISPIWQMILFLATSVLLFLFFYPRLKKFVNNSKFKTNVEAMDGKVGHVVKAIGTDEMGQIKIDGQIWSAISQDNKPISVGDEIVVVEIQGVKAIVKKVV